MAKITLYLKDAQIRSEVSGILTSGMVGVEVELVCDESWEDLSKTLVCRAGDVVKTVLVQNDRAVVAHETMVAGKWLELGVEGRNDDGSVVIPTLWERCCIVLPGADSSADAAVDPTMPIWMQLQKRVESLEVPHAPSDIGALPTPLAAEVGQYLRVAGVNSIGAVTQVEAVDAPKQNDDAVKTVNGIAPDENGNVQIPVSGGNVDVPENVALLEDVTVDEVSGDFIPMLSANGTEYRLSIGDDGIPVIKNLSGATVWSGTSGGSMGGDSGGTGDTGSDVSWTDGVPYTFTIIANEYIDKGNGEVKTDNNWSRTDYTPCAGAARLVHIYNTYSSGYNAFYDINKTFIQAFSMQTSPENSPGEILVPENAAYFRISSTTESMNAMIVTPYET